MALGGRDAGREQAGDRHHELDHLGQARYQAAGDELVEVVRTVGRSKGIRRAPKGWQRSPFFERPVVLVLRSRFRLLSGDCALVHNLNRALETNQRCRRRRQTNPL